MDFKTRYPEYASVEEHVRHAHAERAVYVAHLLADAIYRVMRGVKAFGASVSATIEAREKEAGETDLFLKKAVHRY
ncbi:MAG TPA: hypothetical protein VGI57_01870 [Usitatibacter sp.]|jgi:hypothetical protein